MAPKDKDTKWPKSGFSYWFRWGKLDCDESSFGESTSIFGERYKEHFMALSPIYEHQSNTGHNTTLVSFSIVCKGGHNLARLIKEFIYIRVTNSILNRNIGKYNLPLERQSSVYLPRTHDQQHKHGDSQVHIITLVPPTRCFIEENISCDISNPRRIMKENISSRPDEAFLWGRGKLVNQGKIFCFYRTYDFGSFWFVMAFHDFLPPLKLTFPYEENGLFWPESDHWPSGRTWPFCPADLCSKKSFYTQKSEWLLCKVVVT